MANPSALPKFDPYEWPVIDKANSINVVMQMINGIIIYESCMCLETYISVCTKAKLKTTIFRLMTVAVAGHTIGTVLFLLDLNSLTRNDLTMGNKEYAAVVIRSLVGVIAKISYYLAATLRSRALLLKNPKLLWAFYILLVLCILNNLAVAGIYLHLLTTLHHILPKDLPKNLPMVMNIIKILQTESGVSAGFDTTLSYTLMVTFLYPIYKSLQMEFRDMVAVMCKHGDVQKAFVVCASMTLSAATAFRGLDGRLPLSAAALSFVTQDTMFLRLSYRTTNELITKGSLASSRGGGGQTASVQKSRIGPHPPSNPGVVKTSAMV